MKIHFFQHVHFEGPGSISEWIKKNGHHESITRLYAADPFPPIDEVDWLFIMGGPMSACDELQYFWLREEKRFIEEAIRRNKVVVGICLGAQILAAMLGGKIYPNRHKEIGWFPIEIMPKAVVSEHFRWMPSEIEVFQWHGDTFDLPDGAVLAATGKACTNQAFTFGRNVFAFQFHLETTEKNALALIENCGTEMVEAPYIQKPHQIMSHKEKFLMVNRLMDGFLDRLSQDQRKSRKEI